MSNWHRLRSSLPVNLHNIPRHQFHAGWSITQGPPHPVTGVWRAVRFGVSINAGTYEALIQMIDDRNANERAERQARVQS